MMATPLATGEIPRNLDDAIAAMVYSMIGEPSVEAQLRYHLSLSQKSVCTLQMLVKHLQHKNQELEAKYIGGKEEASMNATALRQKIGELDALKGAYDQLLKECELFRTDREIFAEVAEDAEERRAEADKRAVEAEQRASEAEQREKTAISFIENVLKFSHTSPDLKSKWATLRGMESSALSCSDTKARARAKQDLIEEDHTSENRGLSKSGNKKKVIMTEASIKSPRSLLSKDTRGTKRVLFEGCKAREEIRNVARRKVGKGVLIERSKFSETINKAGRLQASNKDDKENSHSMEAETMTKIEEAAKSDNETVRYLAELLVILKRNLVKAEAEGDLIYAKYCEIHKLLMDTLEAFGILPEIGDGRVRSDDSSE